MCTTHRLVGDGIEHGDDLAPRHLRWRYVLQRCNECVDGYHPTLTGLRRCSGVVNRDTTRNGEEVVTPLWGVDPRNPTANDSGSGNLPREDRPSARIRNTNRDGNVIVDSAVVGSLQTFAQQMRCNHRRESRRVGTPQHDGVWVTHATYHLCAKKYDKSLSETVVDGCTHHRWVHTPSINARVNPGVTPPVGTTRRRYQPRALSHE